MTIHIIHLQTLISFIIIFLISFGSSAASSLSMEEIQYMNNKMSVAPVVNEPQNEMTQVPVVIQPYQQSVMPPDILPELDTEIKRFRYEITASLGYAVGSDALTENYGPAIGVGSIFLYHKETNDGRTVTAGLFFNGLGAKDRNSLITLHPSEGANNTPEDMGLNANSVFLQAGLIVTPFLFTFKHLAIRLGWRTGYAYMKTSREYTKDDEQFPVSPYTRRARGFFIGQYFDIGFNVVENGGPVGAFLRFGLDAAKVWDVELPDANVPYASRGKYGWSFWPTISLGLFLTTRGRGKQ